MLWNSYGKDKISTDGRWRLSHSKVGGHNLWIIYERTEEEEGSVYRGQKETLREAKEYVGGLHTRPPS